MNKNEFSEYINQEILDSIQEIQQSRSQYALEKFVVNQHDTDEMRYYQTLLELQTLYFAVQQHSLVTQKHKIQIDRLRETEDAIDEIDAQLKELELEQTELMLIGALREIHHLTKIYNSFPKKFTRAEIEEAQPDYWMMRMRRQTTLEFAGGTQAAAAHLDSLRQMGVLKVTDKGIEAIEPEPNIKEIKDGATR